MSRARRIAALLALAGALAACDALRGLAYAARHAGDPAPAPPRPRPEPVVPELPPPDTPR